MVAARARSYTSATVPGFVRDGAGNITATVAPYETMKTINDYWQKQARKTPPQLKGFLPASNLVIKDYRETRLRANRYPGANTLDQFPSLVNLANGSIGSLVASGSNRTNENVQLTLKLFERTNPFRSEFSVPVFIRELTDLGSLFKLAASSFAGFVGGAYLNYKFGWVQFVQDVRDLHGIVKVLISRIKELNSLKKRGGLRRKVSLGRRRATATDSFVLLNSTYGWRPHADLTYEAQIEFSGSVRWVANRDFSADLDKLNVVHLAFQKVFDLEELDSATVWELIPWTWLADYFTNLGSYLRAGVGSVLFNPYDVCIMREYQCHTRAVVTDIGNATNVYGQPSGWYAYRSRDVVTSLPSFPTIRFDIFNLSHWKIILALFLRLKGGSS